MGRTLLAAAIILGILLIALGTLRHRWILRKIDAVRHAPEVVRTPTINCIRDPARRTIMIGDSRLSRWPDDLLPGSNIANEGVPGETLAQMSQRFDTRVSASCPDTILIASGINDLVAASFMNRDEADAVVDRVTGTLIALADRGAQTGARVYVATIIPPATPDLLRRLAWSWSVLDYVNEVNQALRSHAWGNSVTLIDFAARLNSNAAGSLDAKFREDTLHINRTGYLALRNVTVSALQRQP